MADGPTPEVSVIFPVYNVREFVANSLGTVQDQTFENIEIICVIDGATDDSADIIESTFRDPRIRIIHQENRGLGGARNTGIRAARAPWITFVDSDDWLHPRFVETLLTKAREGHDIVDCLHNVVDQNGAIVDRRQHVVENFDAATYFRRVISARVPTHACARLYRRTLFDGIAFPESTVHEDVFTVWKLYQRATKAVTVAEALYNWLQREGSLSRSVTRKHIDDLFRSFDDTETSLTASGEIEPTLNEHYRRCYHFASGLANRIANIAADEPQLHSELQRYLSDAIRRSRHFHSKSLARVVKSDPALVRAIDSVVDLDDSVMLDCLANQPGFSSRRVRRPVMTSGFAMPGGAMDPMYTITFAGLMLMAYRKLRLIVEQRRRT